VVKIGKRKISFNSLYEILIQALPKLFVEIVDFQFSL